MTGGDRGTMLSGVPYSSVDDDMYHRHLKFKMSAFNVCNVRLRQNT